MELRDVVGYEELYSVSDDGRVWSKRSGRWLRPHVNHSGYLKVGLNIGARTLNRFVHRLVCEAFHSTPPSPDYQVDHINADHADNRPANLRWVTGDENVQYAVDCGLAQAKRPVVGFNRAGDVRHYGSIAAAEREGFSNVRASLESDDYLCGGYAFVGADEWPGIDPAAYFQRVDDLRSGAIPGAPKRKRKGKIAVRGRSLKNGKVIEFPSCNAAAKAGYDGVWKCINGRQKTCCGRVWEEVEPQEPLCP